MSVGLALDAFASRAKKGASMSGSEDRAVAHRPSLNALGRWMCPLPALLMLLLLALTSGPADAATLADEYMGSWESNDLDEIRTWDNGACQAIFFTTRRYLFSRTQGTGEVTGAYLNIRQARFLRSPNTTCKIGKQQAPEVAYAMARQWGGPAHTDRQGRLVFEATYQRCFLMGCSDDPTMETGPFVATLVRRDDVLEDLGDGKTVAWTTNLHSDVELARLKDEAEAALGEMMGQLQAIEPEDFVRRYVLDRPGLDTAGAVNQVRTEKRMLAHLASRDPIEAFVFDQTRVGGQVVHAQGAIILNTWLDTAGDRGQEIAIILKTASGWRIFLHNL